MSQAAQALLPSWRRYIADWNRQIELMESGALRIRHGNVDVTQEAIQTTKKQRDDMIALITAVEGVS